MKYGLENNFCKGHCGLLLHFTLWFAAVRRALTPGCTHKKSQEDIRPKKKWGFGKIKSGNPSSSSVQTSSSPGVYTNEQHDRAHSVALATAAAAEAAAAAAQATAEIVRLTTATGYSVRIREETAAIKIQTAFKGYMARRALLCLRGQARLKVFMQGTSVNSQTKTALRNMQTYTRVQSQIHFRRIRKYEHNKVFQSQLQLNREKASKVTMGEEWNESLQSKQQIEAKLLLRQEAAIRRERALAYAFTHQPVVVFSFKNWVCGCSREFVVKVGVFGVRSLKRRGFVVKAGGGSEGSDGKTGGQGDEWVGRLRATISALPPVVLSVKRKTVANPAIGLCVATVCFVISMRQILGRRPHQKQRGSVAELVKRGQLRHDRRGISILLKYDDPFNNPLVKVGKSNSTVEMCGKVYRLAPVTLTKEQQSGHQKRRSRAYEWKRPTIFLKEGDPVPPDVDPDTVRWIPANHPFATTTSELDEDLVQNNVYQKDGVPFRIKAEHEALQNKLEALQREQKLNKVVLDPSSIRDFQRPFKSVSMPHEEVEPSPNANPQNNSMNASKSSHVEHNSSSEEEPRKS